MKEEVSTMAEREKFEITRAKFLYISQVLDALKAEYQTRLNRNEHTTVLTERNKHVQGVKELMEKFITGIYQEIGKEEPMETHFEVFTATLKDVQPDTGAVSDLSISEFLGSPKYSILWETVLADMKSAPLHTPHVGTQYKTVYYDVNKCTINLLLDASNNEINTKRIEICTKFPQKVNETEMSENHLRFDKEASTPTAAKEYLEQGQSNQAQSTNATTLTNNYTDYRSGQTEKYFEDGFSLNGTTDSFPTTVSEDSPVCETKIAEDNEIAKTAQYDATTATNGDQHQAQSSEIPQILVTISSTSCEQDTEPITESPHTHVGDSLGPSASLVSHHGKNETKNAQTTKIKIQEENELPDAIRSIANMAQGTAETALQEQQFQVQSKEGLSKSVICDKSSASDTTPETLKDSYSKPVDDVLSARMFKASPSGVIRVSNEEGGSSEEQPPSETHATISSAVSDASSGAPIRSRYKQGQSSKASTTRQTHSSCERHSEGRLSQQQTVFDDIESNTKKEEENEDQTKQASSGETTLYQSTQSHMSEVGIDNNMAHADPANPNEQLSSTSGNSIGRNGGWLHSRNGNGTSNNTSQNLDTSYLPQVPESNAVSVVILLDGIECQRLTKANSTVETETCRFYLAKKSRSEQIVTMEKKSNSDIFLLNPLAATKTVYINGEPSQNNLFRILVELITHMAKHWQVHCADCQLRITVPFWFWDSPRQDVIDAAVVGKFNEENIYIVNQNSALLAELGWRKFVNKYCLVFCEWADVLDLSVYSVLKGKPKLVKHYASRKHKTMMKADSPHKRLQGLIHDARIITDHVMKQAGTQRFTIVSNISRERDIWQADITKYGDQMHINWNTVHLLGEASWRNYGKIEHDLQAWNYTFENMFATKSDTNTALVQVRSRNSVIQRRIDSEYEKIGIISYQLRTPSVPLEICQNRNGILNLNLDGIYETPTNTTYTLYKSTN